MKKLRECHFIITQDKNILKLRPPQISLIVFHARRNPFKEQILQEVQVQNKVSLLIVLILILIIDNSIMHKKEDTIRKVPDYWEMVLTGLPPEVHIQLRHALILGEATDLPGPLVLGTTIGKEVVETREAIGEETKECIMEDQMIILDPIVFKTEG